MKFLKTFLVLLLFYEVNALNFSCPSDCTIPGVNTTEEEPNFEPKAEVNTTVLTINFKNSVMHTFTNEICVAFPNVTKIEADYLSLRKVASDALYDCTKLTYISFAVNHLEELDNNLFTKNPELKEVWLTSNLLKKIDGQMFVNLKILETLFFSNNSLTEIPLHGFPKLGELTQFHISLNNLTDVDERDLDEKFPNLKHISLDGNLFDCNRLRTILNFLKRKNIEQTLYSFNRHQIKTTKIDGIDCLTEETRFGMFLNSSQLINRTCHECLKTSINNETSTNGTVLDLAPLEEQLWSMYTAFMVFVAVDFAFFLFFSGVIWKMYQSGFKS